MPDVTSWLAAALADRYRIERELGHGGMATVYLAYDVKHDRKVALKVLRPELSAVLGAERFVREIKTTARLQHPSILPLFDSGQTDDSLYYVMPYVEGETLRDKLNREKQLAVDEAVRITREVADALDYAHRHGVIHRDIKPENILLHDGRPMVADFGIALAMSAAAGGRMTETGLSLGTPYYMSPEQAAADREITARSDIYSLASALYEMLTGDPPHTGSSLQHVMMKIITEEAAPVDTLRRAVPPNVAAAVAKALEKLPADRFESARAFAEALADPRFRHTMAPEDTRPSTRTPLRRTTVGLAVALVLMTLAASWEWTRHPPARPTIQYELALPPDQAPDPDGYVLITSDGSRIVYPVLSVEGGRPQLWVKQWDHFTALPLAGTEGATAAAISPDDHWIAVVRADSLFKLPITGGGGVPLAGGISQARGAVAWLDDGTLIYGEADRNRLIRIPDTGGAGTAVWASDSIMPLNLAPLPGARGVLFQGCTHSCTLRDLWALDLRSNSAHVVAPGVGSGHFVSGGDLVYVRGGTVQSVPFDLGSLRARGNPVVTLDTASLQSVVSAQFAVSSSGTLVMLTEGETAQARRYTMVWVDQSGRETPVDSTETLRVTQFSESYGWTLSPDDTRLAIGVNTSSGDDIWVKALPHGPLSRVTYSPGPELRPRWLPDGHSVSFVTPSGVYLHHADGTGADSLVWPGIMAEAEFSNDGRWLVFRPVTERRIPTGSWRDIYGVRLGVDTVPVPLVVTPYDAMAIALSPDSRWLAYQSDETGRLEVFIRPFPNTSAGKWQVSSGGGTGPLWARDGRELFYLRGDSTMMAVPVTTSNGLQLGKQRELFHVPEELMKLNARWYTPWDVTRDGRFIMLRTADVGRERRATLVVVENWLTQVETKVRE